jgi:HlyD family secretion protein
MREHYAWLRSRWVIWGAPLLVVLLLGSALFRRGPGAVTVEVGRVSRQAVFRSYVSSSGEIVASRYADIGSSVMGRLVELKVAEGERVKSGQVLARIDAVQARSDLEAAGAFVKALESEAKAARERSRAARSDVELALARKREATLRLNRVRELVDQELLPTAELDAQQAASDVAEAQVRAAQAVVASADEALAAAERRVAQARAQVTRARDVVSKTDITAPMDGVVTRLQVREGEMVVFGVQNQPGTILMTISDLSTINAEVKVAEADVLRIEVGQSANVFLEALPEREFTGQVVEVGASALQVVGTAAAAREFRVVVRLDQPDPALRPGLTCDAEILTREKTDVLTVPLQAVVMRPDPAGAEERSGVFSLERGKARFVPVEAGIIGGLDIEVDGVSEGSSVIVGPFQVLRELQDGTTVEVGSVVQ